MPGAGGWYERNGKRVLDVLLSVTGLVLAFPLLVIVAVLVRVCLGRPVLFVQERPGFGGKPFGMIKFRTMSDRKGRDGVLLPDGERLTAFGSILRQTSMDELPEMLNVLRGEMSLVGPRPLLMRYFPYFTTEERERFLVRPGITGLAQVSGRNDLPWQERFALDRTYARDVSFVLDLKILAVTIWRTLERRGLRANPGATMPDLDEVRGARREDEGAR